MLDRIIIDDPQSAGHQTPREAANAWLDATIKAHLETGSDVVPWAGDRGDQVYRTPCR